LVNPDAAEEGAALPVATSVPGLRLMPSMFDPTTMTQVRPTRASHWFRQIESLDVDYVILHLGASTTSATLELFSNSDVGICVTAPEPLAVESTYRFVRSLYFRALRRALTKERFKWKLVEKAAAALPPLAGPRELIVELRRYDDAVALAAAQQLGARVPPRLVVGQTRLKSDLDLGHSMTVIGERFLGIAFDYLGHIEQDDAVWLTVAPDASRSSSTAPPPRARATSSASRAASSRCSRRRRRAASSRATPSRWRTISSRARRARRIHGISDRSARDALRRPRRRAHVDRRRDPPRVQTSAGDLPRGRPARPCRW
ncbi:MAG: hypothetical protein V9F03_05205, partial [Microthrixaceae bacterium]